MNDFNWVVTFDKTFQYGEAVTLLILQKFK